MAFFALLRTLGPLALEHGAPILRDWWKSRGGQSKTKPDPLQQLNSDVDRLKTHAEQVDSNLDEVNRNLEKLNTGLAERDEKLRKWLVTLLAWNLVLTLGLVLMAVLALRH